MERYSFYNSKYNIIIISKTLGPSQFVFFLNFIILQKIPRNVNVVPSTHRTERKIKKTCGGCFGG